MKQTKRILKDVENKTKDAYQQYVQTKNGKVKNAELQAHLKGQIQRIVNNIIERYPLIVPIIIEI